MAVQAALAAVILFTYNWLAIALGVASLGLVLIYPFAKRFTWWPQAFLGKPYDLKELRQAVSQALKSEAKM